MKLKYFLIFALIGATLVSPMSSPAGAITTYLDAWYYSLSGLKDGEADYDLEGVGTHELGTRLEVAVLSDDGNAVTATQEFLKQKGVLKIRSNDNGAWGGGEFYVIKDGIAEKAISADFTLVANSELGDDWTVYEIVDDYGYSLLIAEDLHDSIFSWTFPDMPSLNNTAGTTISYTPTEFQSFVPYVKFETDAEGKATSLKWSLVHSNDISKPLSFDFPVQVKVQQIRTYEGTTGTSITTNDGWQWFDAETEISGDATFDAIDVSKVFRVRFRFMTYITPEGEGEPKEERYEWQFINPELTQQKLNTIQMVRTSLDQTGKPDYSTAKLRHMYVGIEDNPTVVEHWQFFPENILENLTLKISGGGYSLVDETTDEVLKTVPSGQDETLELMPLYDNGVVVGGTYWEVQPYNSETKHWIDLYDDTGALNGKTATLIYSNGVSNDFSIPKYKTVKEQLADIVPYVELVSADGKLTQVKLCLVASNDVNTAKNPDYVTDFDARVIDTSGDVVEKFEWKNDTHEETWTLDKSYPLDTIQRVRLDVRSYEYSEENPARYRWNFYLSKVTDAGTDPVPNTETDTKKDTGTDTEKKTEETKQTEQTNDSKTDTDSKPEPTPENNNIGGSGGGGCETVTGFWGLAILGIAFLLRRSK